MIYLDYFPSNSFHANFHLVLKVSKQCLHKTFKEFHRKSLKIKMFFHTEWGSFYLRRKVLEQNLQFLYYARRMRCPYAEMN